MQLAQLLCVFSSLLRGENSRRLPFISHVMPQQQCIKSLRGKLVSICLPLRGLQIPWFICLSLRALQLPCGTTYPILHKLHRFVISVFGTNIK